jgi:signal transduction histidine kinase
MSVSFFFSMVIYQGLMIEINRISRIERFQVQTGPFEYRVFRPATIDPEVIRAVKARIAMTLAVVNGIILVSAGGLGYMLAGKTLKPIAEMVEEQNRFISDASHELRTPLTSLKTSIEVGLRDKKMDMKTARKLMAENLSEINRLQSLSEGLLQLTQYKTGNTQLKFERVSLKKVSTNAVSKMAVIAREKKMKINNTVKEYHVEGNEYSLTDLLVILIDNAIKYSKAGGEVWIDAKKARKTVSLIVTDEGIGIKEEDLPHVFDRFYRAEAARNRQGSGGYGLGLSIAKKIADAHNATITIDSAFNKGTTVTVSFQSLS